MGLNTLLAKKRAAITKRWFELVVKTYPSDTQKFLSSQKDPFANPVGEKTLSGLKGLFDEILKDGIDRNAVLPHLDPIVRIRAVQNFSPTKAVAFVLDLKNVVRSVIGEEVLADQGLSDWLKFEHNVDALALIGFDIYMECREKIFAMKADNERARVLKTFSRAGLLAGLPDSGGADPTAP